jgi:nucleotide-binding universal stress UspA family protein
MNGTYRNILAPYDGSEYSKKALHIDTQLAKINQAQVYVVNVVDISQVKPPGKFFSRSEQKSLEQIKRAVKESAKSSMYEIQQSGENFGISIKSFVLEGPVSKKLLQFIKQHNINLVVVGSRGLSGISRIMTLGSVSRNISEETDCPVIIVH